MIQYGKMCTARQAEDDIIRRMRFACRLTKAADTCTHYVIPTVFPRPTLVTLTCFNFTLQIHCLSC